MCLVLNIIVVFEKFSLVQMTNKELLYLRQSFNQFIIPKKTQTNESVKYLCAKDQVCCIQKNFTGALKLS